jgi:hypothetical protein
MASAENFSVIVASAEKNTFGSSAPFRCHRHQREILAQHIIL